MKRPLRLKPMTVTPRLLPWSTASAEGALTADIIGMPAIADFCTSSNDARAETCRTARLSGRPVPWCRHRPPDDLVDRVVAADVFASDEEFGLGIRVIADGEERCGVDSPGLVEDLLLAAQAIGQFADPGC